MFKIVLDITTSIMYTLIMELTTQDIKDYADQLDELYFTDQIDDDTWDALMARFLENFA